MSTQFAPVELATIKQGNFTKQCEQAFSELQRTLIEHVEKFEVSASAVLAMKVSVKYEREKQAYAIVTDIEQKQPKNPSEVTNAFVAEDQTRGNCLWAPITGTTKGDPRQAVLCTDKGDAVNTTTGEVETDKKKK